MRTVDSLKRVATYARHASRISSSVNGPYECVEK